MATQKATKQKAQEQAAPTEAQVITTYKGFDADWRCRGYQFEVGKTYEHDGAVAACASGFHACEYPLHVLRYYKPSSSVFAVVQQSGTLSRRDGDSKIASSKLRITAQIDLGDLIKSAIKYTMGRCTQAEGAHTDKDSHAVAATKPRESATASGTAGAATASGYAGAATASGECGAATASGTAGAATASGRNSKARGKDGCVLFLVRRDNELKITHAKALIVGQNGIKADTWYRLDDHGNASEVA